MTAIIIEDEKWSSDYLKSILETNFKEIKVLACLNSVTTAYAWLMDNEHPDLAFMDIELGDGTSFDLLDVIKFKSNIIFTTAYNQYALKAFKYNSVDYLLKPIEIIELKRAFEKWKSRAVQGNQDEILKALRKQLNQNFKQRFLVKSGDKYQTVETSEIAYIFSEDSYTQIMEKSGKKWFIEYSLEDLEDILDPINFFRVNRKVICSHGAINQIASYFNARLSISLKPEFNDQIVISRDKVKPFKAWLDS